MLTALILSFRQLGDPRVLRLLGRSIAVTLLVLAVLLGAGWWALDGGLKLAGVADFAGEGALRGVLALVAVVIAGWLLWRVIAFAVLQFYADDVVEAVEARHYPAALAAARPLGWRAELRRGLGGAVRALVWNLAALPIALALLVTGVGTPILFWAVNAVLLGRELTDMVWLRHRSPSASPSSAPSPLASSERLMLGGIVSGLMFVPVLNLLAPFLGAAMATHLIHRKRGTVLHASR